MRTCRRAFRWTSAHGARRPTRRWRSGRCPDWPGTDDWVDALVLAGEGRAEPAGASARQRGACGTDQASPAFVELVPALRAGPSQCTIELCDPGGRKLTLSLRAAPGPDLVALTRSLWRALR